MSGKLARPGRKGPGTSAPAEPRRDVWIRREADWVILDDGRQLVKIPHAEWQIAWGNLRSAPDTWTFRDGAGKPVAVIETTSGGRNLVVHFRLIGPPG